jgi:hypothetical protein
MIDEEARAPKRNLRAETSIDFPTPVSPLKTFSPAENSAVRESIRP